jgi:hypothetical protein
VAVVVAPHELVCFLETQMGLPKIEKRPEPYLAVAGHPRCSQGMLASVVGERESGPGGRTLDRSIAFTADTDTSLGLQDGNAG